MRKLVIMRGLPGSGKSTEALRLAMESGHGGAICSTDEYFIGSDGVYRFDPKRIALAHTWNQERARTYMKDGCPLVIIDNTNTQAWEPREYCISGIRYGYDISFHEVRTPWAFDCEVLAQRNTHGCPLAAIERMAAHWQSGLTVDLCLGAKAPWE